MVLIIAVIAMFASVTTVLAATNQHSKLQEFADDTGTLIVDPQDIKGSSAKLTRGEDSVTISIKTTRLPVGAYTNWWVIWNDTSECGDGAAPLLCGLGDLGSPSNSVFFASGGVTNSNGVGHFGATLEEGGIPAGLFDDGDNTDELDQVRVANGGGLGDAQTSEVHYIIRYHGPADPDPVELMKQTSTINYLCGTVVPLGKCWDPQAVGFVAP